MSETSFHLQILLAFFSVFVVFPLGVWKLLEIIIYLINHLRIVP
jgi:hypothetical protein